MKKLSMVLVLLFATFFISKATLATNERPNLKLSKKLLKKKPLKVLCRTRISVANGICPPGSAGAGGTYVSSVTTTETCSENGVVICSESHTTIIRSGSASCYD